jgi:hypothetical protein
MSDDATRYPLAWPSGWRRTTSRRQAMFSKKVRSTNGVGSSYLRTENLSVGDGLQRLQGELRRLGARNPVISSNLRCNLDGSIKANQPKMLADPGVAVYFRLNQQPRVLACDKWNSAADNMAAIAGHIEAIRAQERYGVGTLDQAFAGYAALPPVGGTQGGDWRAELGFAPNELISPNVVEARYRKLLQERHPDHGGSHDAIVRLNVARDAARAYFTPETERASDGYHLTD